MNHSHATWCYWSIALITLAGCASSSETKPARETRRLGLVDQQLASQEAEIRRLSQTIDSLEKELKKKPVASSKKSATSLPLTRLTPEAPNDEDIALDDGWENEPLPAAPEEENAMRAENVIADSRGSVLNHYYRGLHYFEEHQYDNASREFRSFLTAEPEHPYADRAQYMELECHFENHDYGLAVFASNQLEAKYPYSLRLPEALQKRAMAYLEMGQSSTAAVTLRDLLRRYPESSVADSASRLLANLSQDKNTAPGEGWEGHL